MKVEIENYRGWDISFDTDKESFYAVSSEFDTSKEKVSYASIKKAIDDYIKDNLEFKPFKAIYIRWSGEHKVIEFIGIRKDRRFIYKSGDSTEQFSTNDEDRLFEFNSISFDTANAIAGKVKEKNDFNEKINKEIEELKSNFTRLNLNSVRAKYLKA